MARNSIDPRLADPSLARARQIRWLALAASLATFAFLAVAFGWQWAPYIQFPAGLVCYLAYMWYAKANKKVTEIESAARRSAPQPAPVT